jgi:hypothetical protein
LYYFHEIMFFKALSAFKALIYYMFIEWQTNNKTTLVLLHTGVGV